MHSSLISKIEKAKRYADQPERVSFIQFAANLQGEHAQHTIAIDGGRWSCTCTSFPRHGLCSHTLAMHHLLEGMVPSLSAEHKPA